MSVEFDEPAAEIMTRPSKQQSSSFGQMLIKTGIVKTEATAQIVLLAAAVILLFIAGSFFMQANQQPPAPTPEQVVL